MNDLPKAPVLIEAPDGAPDDFVWRAWPDGRVQFEGVARGRSRMIVAASRAEAVEASHAAERGDFG